MSATPPPRRSITAGSEQELPGDLTAVLWANGTVECRHRLAHPDGSLVATVGEIGQILADPGVSCTVCTDACAP
jgi:hypothetical protein